MRPCLCRQHRRRRRRRGKHRQVMMTTIWNWGSPRFATSRIIFALILYKAATRKWTLVRAATRKCLRTHAWATLVSPGRTVGVQEHQLRTSCRGRLASELLLSAGVGHTPVHTVGIAPAWRGGLVLLGSPNGFASTGFIWKQPATKCSEQMRLLITGVQSSNGAYEVNPLAAWRFAARKCMKRHALSAFRGKAP